MDSSAHSHPPFLNGSGQIDTFSMSKFVCQADYLVFVGPQTLLCQSACCAFHYGQLLRLDLFGVMRLLQTQIPDIG